MSDLEILFHYVKKLLEANAEVAFATGADFVSTQVGSSLISSSFELQWKFSLRPVYLTLPLAPVLTLSCQKVYSTNTAGPIYLRYHSDPAF